MPYTYEYPHMAVATDVCVIAGRKGAPQLLLIRRKNPPFAGKWALPGGFAGMDETMREAARRELREETGIDAPALVFLGYFDAIDRDPRERTLSFAFLAALPEPPAAKAADDARETAWFPLDRLPDLAFDHARIVECARTAWRKAR